MHARLPDDVPRVRTAASIVEIDREAWNACYPGEIEDYDYLLTVEAAGIEGFQWRYITLVHGGQVIAAMPAFLTDYRLDTTLEEGILRRLATAVRRYAPGFLTLRLACLGSPCTEDGAPGFHPFVLPQQQPALLRQLLCGFEQMADAENCALRGVKDVPATLPADLRAVFAAAGYAALPGLATAYLDMDFDGIGDYMARLSPATRKDMRRKLRAREAVSVEYRSDIADVLPRLMALYNDTRIRGDRQFEILTGAYFAGVLGNMPGRAFCTLYNVEGRLLAANLLVRNENVLIDKFFCMDAAAGREYNLYYQSWFENLEYCLKHGLGRYQSGQAHYENKLRLGSRLTANTMFFRHRNPIVQALLRLVSPLFAIPDSARTA